MKMCSRKCIWENMEILFLSILITQYMGALGSFEQVIPATLASLVYIIYRILFFFYSIYGVYYVLIRKQRGRIKKPFFIYICFFMYLIFAGLICANDYNMFGHEITRLLGTAAIAMYIGYKFSLKRIILIAGCAQSIIVGMIWYLYLFYPSIVTYSDAFFGKNLIGLYTTKNTCAYELAFGVIIALVWVLFYTEGIKKISGMILAVVQLPLIVTCHAVGALVCVIFALIISLLYTLKKRKMGLGTLFISVTAVFWIVVYVILPLLGGILSYFGKSITLTGRTTIWRGILQYISKNNWLLGTGYGTFWNNDNNISMLWSIYSSLGLQQFATGAHNLVLEILLQTGVIGVILFMMLAFFSLNEIKIEKNDGKEFLLTTVLFYTIRSLVERTFSSMSYDLLFFLIMIVYSIWHNKNYSFREKELERKGKNCKN